MPEFSDYVIYADESGDHSLERIDRTYPVFVLCLCIFRKKLYIENVVPNIQRLKFDWFGHDEVVLHEREIRKKKPPFEFLNIKEDFDRFMTDLNSVFSAARINIIASVIDKRRLKNEYLVYENPYHLALGFCIENTFKLLRAHKQENKITHFIFERRGRKEDSELQVEFLRIVDGNNSFHRRLPNFEIVFADKKANSTGMQLADLTARPIGMRFVRPEQSNRAFRIIERKLFAGRGKKGIAAVRSYP
jgi:hypothetical protein